MNDRSKLKKSEFLEVRIAHRTKQAFMARCRSNGSSASETLRGFVEDYLSGPATPCSPRSKALRWLAAAGALTIFGALAAPTLARPSVPAEFARLDVSGDGGVSFDEFAKGATLDVTLSVGAQGPVLPVEGIGLGSRRTHLGLDADVRRRIVREAFDEIDADHNGELSLAEFRPR